MLRRVTARTRPLRVLMTADAVGGVWTYALDLARDLGTGGHAVTLAVAGPPPSAAQCKQLEAVAGTEIVALDAPLDWTAVDEAELGRAARATAEVAARVRPDVVHMNSPALAGYADFGVATVGVCHSCLATWWQAVRGGPAPADLLWRIDAARRGLAACRALVAPTHAFAVATAGLYGVPTPIVIPNGRAAGGSQARPAPEPLVLTAGRLWDEGKDLRTLDEAARWIEAPVVALGSRDAPDGHRVDFAILDAPGTLDAAGVAAAMARAQVYVSTARYEPFGLAVLEAALAGLPLVLSDIPTFRELWSDAADFVPVGDAAGFAAACNRLLGDPEMARRNGEAAQRRAKRYDTARMTRRYVELYRTVAAIGAVPGGACA